MDRVLRALRAFHVVVIAFGIHAMFAQSESDAGVLHYDIVEVGTLGISSRASAVNSSGQVAGIFVSAEEHGRAFVYSGGGITDIGTLGGTNSFAQGINALGQVVGETYLAGDNVQRGFLYSDGVLRDVGTLGGSFSEALDINDFGQIVGRSYSPTGDHAFRYDALTQTMTDLGTLGGSASSALAINNRGQVVGSSEYSNFSSSRHAFLYSDGSMTDLGVLGGDWSFAFDVNDAGQVVGSSTTGTSGSEHAFLDSGGNMVDLGALGGSVSSARGINSSGDIVGYANGKAFLYSDGVMHDLSTLISPLSGWTLKQAMDINDAGQIVGEGYFGGVSRAFLMTPVPEPAGTVVAGAASLLLLRRPLRRRVKPPFA